MVEPEVPATTPPASTGGARVWTDASRPPLRRGWVWMSLFAACVLAIEAGHVWIWSGAWSFGLGVLAGGLILLTAVSALAGLVLLLVAFARALVLGLAQFHRPSPERTRPSAVLRAGARRFLLGCLPLGVVLGARWAQLGERVHLAVLRAELESVVRGEPVPEHTFYEWWTEDDATIVCVCASGISDCYWLVHDPCGDPWHAHPRLTRVELLRHLEGPWYSMVW